MGAQSRVTVIVNGPLVVVKRALKRAGALVFISGASGRRIGRSAGRTYGGGGADSPQPSGNSRTSSASRFIGGVLSDFAFGRGRRGRVLLFRHAAGLEGQAATL